MSWDDLTPPYSTVVVDPPWHYDEGTPPNPGGPTSTRPNVATPVPARPLPYSTMTLDEIKALPVGDLVDDGRCFLWITNRYLRYGWDVLGAWGFKPQTRTLVWCKRPMGTANVTTEFVLIGSKGRPSRLPWHPTTWFDWPRPFAPRDGARQAHSSKPDAFIDLVESWCPGPYVELFCRRPRLGWDSWGKGYELGGAA